MEHPNWEYRIVDEIDESQLNAMGNEGWELVGVSGALSTRSYLKRQVLGFREQVTLDQKRRYYDERGVRSRGRTT